MAVLHEHKGQAGYLSGNGVVLGSQSVSGSGNIAGVSYSAISPRLLSYTTLVNFNVITDTALNIVAAAYILRKIVVVSASISLTTAAGGIYTAAAKAGSALVSAAQLYATLSDPAKFLDLTLAAPATTDVLTGGTLYFSLTTPQGAVATASIFIFGDVVG